ncbi:MAG: ice-binding family protein [Gammaproteobacteria bacterium]
MNYFKLYLSAAIVGIPALFMAAPVFAADAPELGTASEFAVLSAAPDQSGAVTCTDTTIIGDVGSSGQPESVVQTNCTITGTIVAPVSIQVIEDFNSAYDEVAALSCDEVLTGTLADVELTPGVYCFEAAATLTGTLTLVGGENEVWIFKVGTGGTGALTATGFTVTLANGAATCNVYWWSAQDVTLTDSAFKGNLLSGAAITVTGGTFEGDAMAKGAVTLTGAEATGCDGGSTTPTKPERQRCDQGVGNGPEGCDPGNSNQGIPFLSNDELGGVPGNPGKRNPGRRN